jgi:hypothetical protein
MLIDSQTRFFSELLRLIEKHGRKLVPLHVTGKALEVNRCGAAY